ncbi:MAG: LptF/LptG family permease [Bacteroidales bacterium]|nr:LptF/LptG family permease [Bacteroidales bacterium]
MNLKPRILDYYISKKFILTFFVSLILIIGIVIIFDISEKINSFVENQAPLYDIVFKYYLNFIPYFVNMFSPLFVFITVIFFTSRMAENSEIIAILSGGVSFNRMMVPYMASAVLIAIMSLGLNIFIIPQSNKVRIQFEAKYIKRHNVFKHSNIHYQTAPGEFVYVENFSDWNKTAYNFTIENIEGNRIKRKLSADSAVWDSTSGSWHLRNYFIREFTGAISDRVRSGAAMDTLIALKIEDFYHNEKTVETQTMYELDRLIKTQKMRGDAGVVYAQIEKHTRLAMPFSAIILTIIGVSLSSRKRRGGLGWNIAFGIALAFTYILFLRFSQMFVFGGLLPPWIALRIPNIIYAGIAVFLYLRAPK